jgi:hypothetical protein
MNEYLPASVQIKQGYELLCAASSQIVQSLQITEVTLLGSRMSTSNYQWGSFFIFAIMTTHVTALLFLVTCLQEWRADNLLQIVGIQRTGYDVCISEERQPVDRILAKRLH